MELYYHADPYKCYLHHPTPEVGKPSYPAGVSLEEYYGQRANREVVAEVQRLFQGSFRAQVIFGQRHFAPSASWRDEHVTSQSKSAEPGRFAVRVHIFEERARVGALEARAGRYLGFVALRPEDPLGQPDPDPKDDDVGYDHVVEAEVTCPAHMMRPRYHLIMTTISSARMGVLPFKSAVYMAPRREETWTSTCVHLAISQALHLVMGRFGCRPVSQREFDAYVWKLRCDKYREKARQQRRGSVKLDWPRLRDAGSGDKTGGGVRLTEALEVLKSCSAGGFVAHFSELNCGARKAAFDEAWRCLTDVLANGLPVVMMINHNLLAGTVADSPHAQLIFGMRLMHCSSRISDAPDWQDREDLAELPGEFIGHDIFQGPYYESCAKRLLEAAWDATAGMKENDQRMPGINFLVIGPSTLSVEYSVARGLARQYMRSLITQRTAGARLLRDYYELAGLSDEWFQQWTGHATDWRYIARLMRREEFLSRDGLRHLIEHSLPDSPWFWIIEVWHPHASHSMHALQPPDIPPPVILWCDASHVPDDAVQRHQGVLHCVLDLQKLAQSRWEAFAFH